MFKKYNIRDVETEMGIQHKLRKFPVHDEVWTEYHIDQEINDRGVGLDMVLVRQAIEMDNRSHEELTANLKSITGLENPNSVIQMKQWLSDNGHKTDSLIKRRFPNYSNLHLKTLLMYSPFANRLQNLRFVNIRL